MEAEDDEYEAERARGAPISKEMGPLLSDAALTRYASVSGKRPERQADGSVHFI